MERNRPPKKSQAPEDRPGRAVAAAPGRSGRGSESVRPYLRAQLKLKELLVPQFPPPGEGLGDIDPEDT
jgi:hypothetical protein